jgi:hypothetical protein
VKTWKVFNGIADAVSQFDNLEVGLAESRKRGLPFYADVAPFDRYFPGLEENYYEENPDLWLWSRDQESRYRGIPCYQESAARERLLAEVEELLERGVDGVQVALHSHMGGGAEERDKEHGFNPPIVREFKERWGTDILSEDFDRSKLHQLYGEHLTDLLRDIRELMGSKKRLGVWIMLGGHRRWGSDESASYLQYGGSYRINLEWERWTEEGIVDDLFVDVFTETDDAVEDVRRRIKDRITRGRVLLSREPEKEEMFSLYQRELAQIRAGELDGFLIDEGARFEPPHTAWCSLLEGSG